MKKQKVVLGTDDKHVYFKMQNRKQAVRFAKWFVYMCVCNVFEYSAVRSAVYALFCVYSSVLRCLPCHSTLYLDFVSHL